MADAKNYAQRNQRGSDWFSHDSSAAAATTSPTHKAHAEAALPESAKSKNGAADGESTRTQMIKPKCDSNQWFKHDAKADAPAPVSPVHEASKTNEVAAAGSKSDSTPSAKGRDSREGDSYGRRDKMGSSGTWFAHDHADSGAAGGVATPRVTTKEGGDNANRMRGESENWYNYDANKGGATAPQDIHVSKGRSNRPQNDEMHGIFHHGK